MKADRAASGRVGLESLGGQFGTVSNGFVSQRINSKVGRRALSDGITNTVSAPPTGSVPRKPQAASVTPRGAAKVVGLRRTCPGKPLKETGVAPRNRTETLSKSQRKVLNQDSLVAKHNVAEK